MRIAMVAACPFPSPQGSQVFVGQMCERLAARGHDVHLLTYGQGAGVERRGYSHHRIRRLPGDDAMRSGPTLIKPALDALMVAALDRLIVDADIDVTHCHNYEGALVGLAVRLRRGVPVVYHSHNLMADELGTYFRAPVMRRLAAATGRLLDAAVPRSADHAIALCEYSAAVMRRSGVVGDRLSVIPPAVDDCGQAGDRSLARARLRMPHDALVVGYAGNLDRYQNLGLLLDGAALLAARRRPAEFRLLVASHAPDRDFERLVAERGLGAVTEIRIVDDFGAARLAMEAADVLVSPRGLGSGYPVKLLNYMSLARPIVTAGCGGKVIADGLEGLVVGDADPVTLAVAVERLAADRGLAERLAAGARRRFVSSLTWDAVLPAIEEVYAKTTWRKRRSATAPVM